MKYAEVLFTPAFKFSSSPWGLSGTIAKKKVDAVDSYFIFLGGQPFFPGPEVSLSP